VFSFLVVRPRRSLAVLSSGSQGCDERRCRAERRDAIHEGFVKLRRRGVTGWAEMPPLPWSVESTFKSHQLTDGPWPCLPTHCQTCRTSQPDGPPPAPS
jgi:hypothetical protein